MEEQNEISSINPTLSRRDLMRLALVAPAALAASRFMIEGGPALAAPKAAPAPKVSGPFKLPPLKYPYNALVRSIDESTMRIHHGKHHQAYVDKLNEAVAKAPALKGKSAQSMLMGLDAVPENVRDAVRNNAGGHVNHTMFWEIIGPKGGGAPTGDIATIINTNFGSFANFKAKFEEAGTKRFGSGWVWLVGDAGKFGIISTPNQDSPLLQGLFPVMGNDVWEHAYYLKYQNKRADYLKAWWNVVDWNAVNKRIAYMRANARG